MSTCLMIGLSEPGGERTLAEISETMEAGAADRRNSEGSSA
jgi:hypothetical protein